MIITSVLFAVFPLTSYADEKLDSHITQIEINGFKWSYGQENPAEIPVKKGENADFTITAFFTNAEWYTAIREAEKGGGYPVFYLTLP